MLQLLMLLLILFGTYATLTLLQVILPGHSVSVSLRGRISLAALFVFTGISHFVIPEELAQLLPAFIPLRMELIAVTGVLEILGAIGLVIPPLIPNSGNCLCFGHGRPPVKQGPFANDFGLSQ